MSRSESSPNCTALGVLLPGFLGPELPNWLAELLRAGLGGVCLFGSNVIDRAQLAALTAAIYQANPAAIIAIDEEGGEVSRLYQHQGSPFPGNAVLGRLGDLNVTASVARRVGAELAEVGIHLTFAPDADVNSNELNPVIGVRSFGADPTLVAAHTAAWVDGVQSAGVAACAKHFPGHGDTATDSHLAEPVVLADAATIATREFPSFRAAITAGTRTVMTSHIRVPALDPDQVATFSPTILGTVLRGQLGFDGLIVTDALDMHGASGEIGIPAAAVRAIAAGADLLCLGSNNSQAEIIATARALGCAEAGRTLPPGRLVDARQRGLRLVSWIRQQPRTQARAPLPSPRMIAGTFWVSWRAKRLFERTGPVEWVVLEPEPNIAVGSTPLGPFFDGGAVPSLVVPRHDRGRIAEYQPAPGVRTMIVGRELHRDPAALAAAQELAARAPSAIVDLGFARPDLVDIATFGASRLVGQALIEMVGGQR